MPKTQATVDFLRKARQEGPNFYKYVPDDVLYRKLSEFGEVPSSAVWKEETFQPVVQSLTENTPEELGFFANLADWWIDDNSYDFMKAAYNRSLTGTLEKMVAGESRYDVDESDFNIAEDIGASLFSFLMPLDVITMGAGGYIGGKVANASLKNYLGRNATSKAAQAAQYSKNKIAQGVGKGVSQKARAEGLEYGSGVANRKLRKEMVDEAVEGAQKSYSPLGDKSVVDALTATQRAVLGGLQQAPALGLYEAALHGMNYEMEGKSFFEGAAYGAFHGGMLGALTGAIGGGMGAVQSTMFAKAGGRTREDLGLKNYLKARGVYGLPGQIGAESTLFSGVELAERVKAGEDIQGKEILHTFARNIGLFGALKTQGILTKKALQKYNETKESLSKDYNEWREKTTNEALDNIRDNISETESVTGGGKVESKSVNREKYNATKDDIKNKEKYKDIVKEFDDSVSKKLFDENGEIKDNILDMSNDGIAEVVYKTNNYLMRQIEEFRTLLKDTSISKELRKQAEESLAEMQNVKKLIDDKFADRSWMKAKESQMTVGGQTREQAKASWSDSIIKEKAKDYKVLDIKEKDGKITNKDEVIDAIYESKREKQQFEKDKARPQEGIQYDRISEDVKVQKFLDKTEDSGINIGEKRKAPEKRKSNAINESNLSAENKNIIADSVVNSRKDFGPSALKETISLFEYIQNKKGVNNVKNLSKAEFESYVVDYVNSKFGKEIVSKKTGQLKEATSIEALFGKDKEVSQLAQKEYKDTYQRLVEVFGSKSTENRLTASLGFNPVLKMKTRAVPGRKEMTIGGGRDSIVGKDGISPKLEKSKKTYDVEGKKVSSYEAHVLVEIMNDGRLRPGENPFNVVVSKELLNTGQIQVGAPGKAFRNINLSNKTLKKIRKLVKDKKLKNGDKIFELNNVKQGNKLFNEIYLDMPKDLRPQIYDTASGKYYAYDKNIKLPQVEVGGKTLGGGSVLEGVQPMSLMRRILSGEGDKISLESSAKARGQKTTKAAQQYGKAGDPPPKPKRKTQVDMGKVKENMEITVERQESMKELILEGTEGRRKAYKNLKIKLNQKLKKEGGEKVLGQIEGHTIRIAEGKVKIDTIPHEVSHYVVDVLKAFGTGADKSLIKRGIKMFGSEEALVQRIGEYATNQLTAKGMMGKAKIWIKAFNARLKDMLGLSTADDVAYIMSRRVVKGNIPQGRKVANYMSRMETHFQTESNFKKPNVKRAISLENKLSKKINKEIIEDAKKRFGIDKKKDKDWTDGEANDYVEFLESVNKSQEAASRNKTSFLDEWVRQYQLTNEQSYAIAEGLGRIDGNFNKLTGAGKSRFAEQVMVEGSVTKQVTTSQTWAQTLSKYGIPHGFKRAFMPTYYVLQKYGGQPGKAIADKLLKFEVVSDSYYKGKGDMAINLIKKELKNKDHDNVWLFDTERVEKMIRDGQNKNKKAVKGLSKQEYAFYLATKDKNGKEITAKTKDSDIVTPEGRAKKIHAKLMQFYWNSMQKEVKNVTNKSEYASFQKEFQQKFVNGYFSRRVTKDAIEYFVSADNTKNLEGLIDRNIEIAAKRKIKDKFPDQKDKTKLDKKVKELIQDESFRNSVAKDVLNMITHKHHKVKNKHLMERGPLIDEFITIKDMKTGKDKTIRVYETSMSATVEPYVMGMSKYLATIRFFPEYTGLGGRYKLSKSSLDNINIMMQDKTLGAYALKAIQKTIGFKGNDPLLSDAHSILSAMSHFSAASGLSSPTSGLKNLMIGIPRAIASFGFINTGKGIIRGFDKANWDKAREKGILEYGAKHLELGQAKLSDKKGLGWISMEKLFRWNFMTQSENFNRIISHEAGLMYFQNQLRVLHGGKGLFGESSAGNAKRLMRDMFKFSDDDIKFLNSKQVRELSFKSKEAEGRYEYLIRQAGHFSHVSAQGGTSVPLLPLWASGNIAKPLTLFQRMAYATTFDSYINYYKPIATHRNFMPLVRALGMHTLSGAALYGFYKSMFGKEPPESGGDTLDKMTMYLYRSEMLGLAGFLFSPYDEGMFQSLSQPVIVRNAREALRQFNHFSSGRDDLGSAIKNWGLKTNVALNQFDQLVFKNTDDYKLMKKIRNYRMQFADDHPAFKKASVDAFSERTYYYRDLKNSLYFGSEKDIMRDYFTAYNFIVTELEDINSSPQWRHKEAIKAIKLSLSNMNPVKISDKSTGRNMSKKKMFLDWVKKNLGQKAYQDVLKSEKNYKFKMRKLEKLVGNKSAFRKHSVYSSLDLF